MKRIADNAYLVKGVDKDEDKTSLRSWHDCPEYKRERYKDKLARIELILVSEGDDVAKFACPHCEFKLSIKDNEFVVLSDK